MKKFFLLFLFAAIAHAQDLGSLASRAECPSGQANCSAAVLGTVTINTIPKATNSTTIGNSSGTDDGTNPTRWPNGLNTATAGNYEEYTVDTGGVSAGLALCVTANVDGSGRPKVLACSHTATQPAAGFAGIAKTTVAAGGTVQTCWTVNCSAIFDNTATVLNQGILSPTIDGELHDTGSRSSTPGQQNFPIMNTNSGAGTASLVSPNGVLANNPPNGGGGGKGTAIEINGTATQSAVNFNSSTPAADANNQALTVKSSSSGNLTSAIFEVPLATTGQAGIVQLAGDLGGTSALPSVLDVHGVSYPSSPSTNTVPVITGSNTVTYEAVPNAALANSSITVNGTTCTLGLSCTPSGAGAVSGTGTNGQLTAWTGASSIGNANLAGDVTTSGTTTTVVGKVNGVSYTASPSTNTVAVVTATNTTTYEAVPNAALANSSITINTSSPITGGSAVSLGGSVTVACPTCSTGSASFTVFAPNNGTNGTTLNGIAKWNAPSSNSDGTVRGAQTSDATLTSVGSIIGIVTGGAGTTGNATITVRGSGIPCTFDGTTTIGDYVFISGSNGTQCHDAGFNHLTSGNGVCLGKVATVNSGAGTTANVDMDGMNCNSSQGAIPSGGTLVYGFRPGSWLPIPTNLGQIGPGNTSGSGATSNDMAIVDGAALRYYQTTNSNFYTRVRMDNTGAETSDYVVDLGVGSGNSAMHVKGGSFYTDQNTQSITGSTTINEDRSGNVWNFTLTGNTTLAVTRDNAGTVINAKICQDATGGRTLTYPVGWLNMATVPAAANACVTQPWLNIGSHNYQALAHGMIDPVILTGQTAAIGTTTLATPEANSGFRVTASVDCTTASAAATVNFTIGWTDTSNTAQTATLGSAALCTTLGSASTGNLTVTFRAKAATNITYATSIANTPTYDLQVFLEEMSSK